jgi:A/G-specific adenine glycosylase
VPGRRLPHPRSLTKGGGVPASDPLRGLDAAALRRRLLAHYDAHRRVMPWRGERDPYRVWVSEVMLQQTRVETVRERWGAFVDAFPTAAALASAPKARVMKAWEGLGYYRRARLLHAAAKEVVLRHGGRLPAEEAALRALPGFGPYTAAAVASIAHRLPHAAVDGNVVRVLARLLDERGDVTTRAVRARLERAASALLDAARPGDWNQAVMDLGATVCVPRSPRCDACPWARACRGRASGKAGTLPRKRAKRAVPHADVAVALVWKGDRILIARRPAHGLLGGLWELPGGKRKAGESLERTCEREVREETGLTVRVGARFAVVEHAYSHLRVTIHVFHASVVRGTLAPRGCEDPRFVRLVDLARYAFPAANRRIFTALAEAVRRGDAPPARARGRASRSAGV